MERWTERIPHNAEVVGSSPTLATNLFKLVIICCIDGDFVGSTCAKYGLTPVSPLRVALFLYFAWRADANGGPGKRRRQSCIPLTQEGPAQWTTFGLLH